MSSMYGVVKNPNYVATVVRVHALEELEGLDNLVALRVFGMQALVKKDSVAVGQLGVLFSTESQLSLDFAAENNLHRHSNLNEDPTQVGYLEDNRRVRAIRLRGHRSDSLFMPLEAFNYLSIPPSQFQEGDVFDSINGHEVVRKYEIRPEREGSTGPKARVRRVDGKVFPQHIDSENYWRNSHKIPKDAPIVVTQKLHGTSVRYGNVPVIRTKSWFEKLLNKWGIPTPETEYQFVAGSRRTIKSIELRDEEGKNHFFAEDLWTEYARSTNLDTKIPKGLIVFGELIGWTGDNKPIQKNYTYEMVPGMAELYVYRMATVLPSGQVVDLPWEQVRAEAKALGLYTVPQLNVNSHADFDADELMDRVYFEDWLSVESDSDIFRDRPVKLSHSGTVDEGVCVRYDGPNGVYILKAKSPKFLEHETKMLDAGIVDVESGGTDG